MNTRQSVRQAGSPAEAESQPVGLSVKWINRLDGEGTLRAFCDLEIGGQFLVKGIRVVEGKNGLFVSMPQEKGKDGNWYDTVLPLSKETRRHLSQVVLSAYQAER